MLNLFLGNEISLLKFPQSKIFGHLSIVRRNECEFMWAKQNKKKRNDKVEKHHQRVN